MRPERCKTFLSQATPSLQLRVKCGSGAWCLTHWNCVDTLCGHLSRVRSRQFWQHMYMAQWVREKDDCILTNLSQ